MYSVRWPSLSGSADIPFLNKSSVCITIPSLCACAPGSTRRYSPFILHPLASPVCERHPYEITHTLWGLAGICEDVQSLSMSR